jgi:SAM-dependent methyltransferase
MVRQVLDWNPGYLAEHRSGYDRLIGLDEKVSLAACGACGFVFAPRYDSEVLRYTYDAIGRTGESKAKAFDFARRRRRTAVWLQLLQMAQRPAPIDLRVLDFGCGWGDFLAVAKAPGVSVLGVDASETQRAFAAQHGVEIVASLDDVDTETIDVAICNQVIEHIIDPREVLISLRRVMREGGIGFFSVPDFTRYPWAKAQQKVDANVPLVKEVNPWEHVNYFDRSSFHRVLIESGFEPVSLPVGLRVKRAVRSVRTALQRPVGIVEYVRAK